MSRKKLNLTEEEHPKNNLLRGQLFLEKSTYSIERDVIDFFNNFQKHSYGSKSLNLVAKKDANLAVLPVFRRFH
ncbi:hypothetical protein TNCV_4743941 [Trichonephila clavipes]|nr:hypothetical protein TNCV_4743941 [Trichonephila clavipes]